MDYNFGNRLQQLLNENNLSQKQLATKVGITEAAVSRYINNLQKPRPDILSDIATVLNTTTDYLLGKETTNLSDLYNEETALKFNKLIKNEHAKILFDKLGDLNDEEIKQVADIVNVIQHFDKSEKKEDK